MSDSATASDDSEDRRVQVPNPHRWECITRYLDTKAHMAPTTITNERWALTRLAASVGADRPISYLTEAQVAKFFITRMAGHQASSVNKMRQRVGGTERMRISPASLVGLLNWRPIRETVASWP